MLEQRRETGKGGLPANPAAANRFRRRSRGATPGRVSTFFMTGLYSPAVSARRDRNTLAAMWASAVVSSFIFALSQDAWATAVFPSISMGLGAVLTSGGLIRVARRVILPRPDV